MFLLVACAVAPRGARALDERRTAAFEDADLRAELALDASGSVVLELINKSDAPLVVEWSRLSVVGPDHVQALVDATAAGSLLPLLPGAHLRVTLPLTMARSKNLRRVELILPTVVRGTPREYHYVVQAALGAGWRS